MNTEIHRRLLEVQRMRWMDPDTGFDLATWQAIFETAETEMDKGEIVLLPMQTDDPVGGYWVRRKRNADGRLLEVGVYAHTNWRMQVGAPVNFEVNWSGHGSVSGEFAQEYAELLQAAAEVAQWLEIQQEAGIGPFKK